MWDIFYHAKPLIINWNLLDDVAAADDDGEDDDDTLLWKCVVT